jgi:hypothetical protein
MEIRFVVNTDIKPQYGDLVISKRGWMGIFGEHENSYENECRLVLPYGVYHYGIKAGDTVLNVFFRKLQQCPHKDMERAYDQSDRMKKVILHPDKFNNQDIVDLNLKDGDEFNVYSVDGEFATLPNGKVVLEKPTYDHEDILHASYAKEEDEQTKPKMFTERENIIHAFTAAYDSCKKGIPHGQALEEYMKLNNKYINNERA